MSDINDDLLNYEVGDIDEDELLLSDDETTPKLSQHEEALLLSDEDLLNEATDKMTNATPVVQIIASVSTDPTTKNKDIFIKSSENEPTDPEEVIATTSASITEEKNQESVTKQPAEPKIVDELFTEKLEKLPQPLPSRRNVLKRNSVVVTTAASLAITPLLATPNTAAEEPAEHSKKLRVEAATFVPALRHEASDLKPIRPPLLELPKPRVAPTAVVSLVSAESDEFYPASSETDYTSSLAEDSDAVSVVAGNCSLDIGDESETTPLTQESLTDDATTAYSEVESELDGSHPPKRALLELETEDSDEGSERLNPKTRVERDTSADGYRGRLPPQQQPLLRNKHEGGRGGFMGGPRHFQPHPYHPYGQHSGNENFNPQFQPQHLFRPQMDRPLNPLMQGGPHQNGPPGPPMHNMPPLMAQQFRGPPPHQQPPPHNFRLPYANDMNRPLLGRPPGGMHPGHRHLGPPRPDYVPNAIRPFNGNSLLRPVGPPSRFEQHRPRMPPNQQPPQQFMPPRLPLLQQYPGAIGPPSGMPPHPANLQMQQQHPGVSHGPANLNPNAPPGPPIMPRKVLINPNFKGGVEAATNQLMMDTLNNPQYVSANNDAELLRQQEAFINQNRMHIEKRRHERSPERERNYSPPRRERRAYSRERDVRKPPAYNSYGRGGGGAAAGDRGRRADSREPPSNYTKRRRSNSGDRTASRGTSASDNRKDKKEPEDEETRAYRLEIEKQKSMREKVLKDKEMRRRKAAEGKTGEEKKADADAVTTGGSAAAPTAKLTPIIVTEKKIISLKKQQAAQAIANGPGAQPPLAARSAAKALPETKKSHVASDSTSAHTAIVRPTIKPPPLTIPKSGVILDEYDEDELLADSPSPSPTSEPTATRFANRRVVLKPSSGATGAVAQPHNPPHVVLSSVGLDSEYGSTTAVAHKSKGIFGRLDRKMNTVTDAAKRKIQRIIVQKDYSD